VNAVLPKWQHRLIWAFSASQWISDLAAAAFLTGCSRRMTYRGAATVAAPPILGFAASIATLFRVAAMLMDLELTSIGYGLRWCHGGTAV